MMWTIEACDEQDGPWRVLCEIRGHGERVERLARRFFRNLLVRAATARDSHAPRWRSLRICWLGTPIDRAPCLRLRMGT